MTADNSASVAAGSAAPSSEDRVPLTQKIGYGLGSIHDMWGHWLYSGLAYQIFNIYLGVNPKWIGRALLFKLLFEAVSDSLFGWWSDNARTRFGRRRPFILAGALCAGVLLPVQFAAQPGWTELQYFGFMATTLALFVPSMSSFYMPFQSLGYEMTASYHERTTIQAVRSGIQKVPEVLNFAAAFFTTAGVWVAAKWADVPSRLSEMFHQLVHWFGHMGTALLAFDLTRMGKLMTNLFGWAPAAADAKPNILLAGQVYTVLLGGMMLIAGVLVFALTREPFYEKLIVMRKQARISIMATLGQTLSFQPFRAVLSMALAYGVGTSMVGALGYYATVYYACHGDVSAGGLWNLYMGLMGMVLGLCGVPTYTFLSRRIGKKAAMIVVQFSAIAVFVATWWLYSPVIPWLQIFASGLIAFTGAGFWILYGSMTADVIDADEIETGQRREGSFAACGSWVLKFGMAIGNWASGEILGAIGFDAKLGGNQTGHVIFMIRFLLAAIPITGLIISLLLLSRFPLSFEKMNQIRTQLEARRGKV
ncbi:MAG TPA: MFS transporter [Candidatus Didemnitutus sp.]|jgi:GPH family glycoside/pentoside/hexuronide:cation symporter